MYGFDIRVNSDPSINIAARCCQLMLTNIDDNILLIMNGIDDKDRKLSWPRLNLKPGDKITVKVKEAELTDQPSKIDNINIEKITEEYQYLKEELEKKGLI